MFKKSTKNSQPAQHSSGYAALFSPQASQENLAPETNSTGADITRWTGWREFTVVDKHFENPSRDICSFYLAPTDGLPIPDFLPGQYITFRLDQVTDTFKPLIRCYSLSQYANGKQYRVSIRLALPPRGKPKAPQGIGSTYFHDHINVGDVLSCKAPCGDFYMPITQPPLRPVVLVASGVGITPAMSILEAYLACFDKHAGQAQAGVPPIYLFYGERTVERTAFKPYLDKLKTADNVPIYYFISQPATGEQQGVDFDFQGYVSVEKMGEIVGTLDCDFYMCGSEAVMNDLLKQFEAKNAPMHQVHYEVLVPETGNANVDPDAPKYQVTCSESDEQITWQGVHGSLLELLKDEDIDVDHGCGQGKCGACTTPVLSGDVEYSKTPHTTVQPGHCLPCICYPTTDLTLDL